MATEDVTHESERRVKKENPKKRTLIAQAFRFIVVHGNEQEFFAEDEMEEADGGVKDGRLNHFRTGDGKNISDEHVLKVFGFAGGLAHQQNGRRRSDRIGNADERFLWNVAAAAARDSENSRSEESEAETNPIRGPAVRVHARDHGHSRSQSGDLRESEVNENYLLRARRRARQGRNESPSK